jgi:hypothetical protein
MPPNKEVHEENIRLLAVVGVQALTADDDNPANSTKRDKNSSPPGAEK